MDLVSIEVNGVRFNMLPVEGGHFLMGATPEQHMDAWDNESPAHSVELDDYYLGETAVTQALWHAVMGGDDDDYSEVPQTGKNWQECQSFLSRLSTLTGRNFRLPTEAEWENAARGGDQSKGYKFAGGNNLEEVAWFDMNSGNRIHPVKQKLPNEIGLYDMCGNVWEWCSDWYGSYPSNEEEEHCHNPKGPLTGSQRVVRGACSSSYNRLCRVSSRMGVEPVGKNYAVTGFRLALDKDEALKTVIPHLDNLVQENPAESSNTTPTPELPKTEKPKTPVTKPSTSKEDTLSKVSPKKENPVKKDPKAAKPKKKAWPWIVAIVAIAAIAVAVLALRPNADEKMFLDCKDVNDYRHYVSQFGDKGLHYNEAIIEINKFVNDSIAEAQKQRIAVIQQLLREAEDILKSTQIIPYSLESYQDNKSVMNQGWGKLDSASKEIDQLTDNKKGNFIKDIERIRESYSNVVSILYEKEQMCHDRSSLQSVKEDSMKRMAVLREYKSFKN